MIIRAHGVPPETETRIREKGVTVINATCPLVTKSQKTAAEYASQGYIIFFAGDKNHGEVVGIEGYARKAAKEADLYFMQQHWTVAISGTTQKHEYLSSKIGGLSNGERISYSHFTKPFIARIWDSTAE